MPPKRKNSIIETSIIRRKFQRGRGQNPTIEVLKIPILYESAYANNLLTPRNCFDENHDMKKKKARNAKKNAQVFENTSLDLLSDDENERGGYVEVGSNTINNTEINNLQQKQDSDEDYSLEIFYGDVRVKLVDGKLVRHQIQPELDNVSSLRKSKNNKDVGLQERKKSIENQKEVEQKSINGYDKFRKSLLMSHAKDKTIAANISFRMFPSSNVNKQNKNEFGKKISNIPENIFSYTPIRRENNIKNRMSTLESTSSFIFSPCAKFASTPIEKSKLSLEKENKILGQKFDFENGDFEKTIDVSDVFEELSNSHKSTASLQNIEINENKINENDDIQLTLQNRETDEKIVKMKKTSKNYDSSIQCQNQEAKNKSNKQPSKENSKESLNYSNEMNKTVELETKERQKSVTPRPADCSLTDLITENGTESLARKRSKRIENSSENSKEAEKIVENSTMMINTNMETIMTNDETTKVEKRTRNTIQPQQQQLTKESRLSVMTSGSSRRESINSLMEDISLEDFVEMEGIENGTIRSNLLENFNVNCSVIQSRAQSAMTIYMENPTELPYFVADMSSDIDDTTKRLLHVVKQKEPIKWSDFPKNTFMAKNLKKLGEGSYGEVFSTIYNDAPVAIKIVPFEKDGVDQPKFANGATMMTSEKITPEIVVMKELNELNNMTEKDSTPNFIELVDVKVVQGEYPQGLLKAWDSYLVKKGDECLNDRPSLYSSKDQMFVAFITSNGGVDLEHFKVKNENEIRSILIQLLLSLLVAEKRLLFEHRDLHLGNVLISKVNEDKLGYKVNDNNVFLRSHGVKASIIDFTLSRIEKDGAIVYQNLENDPEIFTGEGDEQFDVYRQMREHNEKDWRDFHSKTNLWWIEYLAKKLTEEPICSKRVLTSKRRVELRKLFKRLGEFETCTDTFTDAEFYNDFYHGYLDHEST